MGVSESTVHSFIVKLWVEKDEEAPCQFQLQGHITHVPSGERKSLRDLDDIATFMAFQLRSMGVDVGRWWRIKLRLKRFQTK